MISNCVDLWTEMVGSHDLNEAQAKAAVTNALDEANGIEVSFGESATGVSLKGMCAGYTGTFTKYTLSWGFSYPQFNNILAEANKEAVDAYTEING